MGQGSSSPTDGQQVFSADKPLRMSQQVLDSLQGSSETDSTRAKDIELHIQQRVRAELTKLEAEQSKKLKELEKKLAEEPIDGAIGAPATGPAAGKPDLGRESVQKDINSLREKLQQRKLREDVVNDKKVEAAKSAVVSCLRENDKRPLDCWQEVESFKREVARLEKNFLERHL